MYRQKAKSLLDLRCLWFISHFHFLRRGWSPGAICIIVLLRICRYLWAFLSEILGGVLIGIAIFPSQFYSVNLNFWGTPRYANFSFSKFIIVIFVFPIVIGFLFDIGLLLEIIMFIKHYIDSFVIFVDNECVASAV